MIDAQGDEAEGEPGVSAEPFEEDLSPEAAPTPSANPAPAPEAPPNPPYQPEPLRATPHEEDSDRHEDGPDGPNGNPVEVNPGLEPWVPLDPDDHPGILVSPTARQTQQYGREAAPLRRDQNLGVLAGAPVGRVRPTLSEEVISEFRSRFVIKPLESGFGYTLGNTLRRTLLSSVPGAAVTSIYIDGVLHEFSTVPGVKEDVTEIVRNIKNLVVSSENDEPVVMYVRKKGAGPVTAADIIPPAGVEIRNPELRLATLADSGTIEMKMTVERGRGFVSAPQNKSSDQEIGRIPVDSIYSPVLKVAYRVEATRVEQRTDFDKLVVDVETKPAISPRDAVASAGKTLVELFGLARELNQKAEGIEIVPSATDQALAADLALPISDLNLTVQSYSYLMREGIRTVGELTARSEAELFDVIDFGQKSIDEVKNKLAKLNLALRGSSIQAHRNGR